MTNDNPEAQMLSDKLDVACSALQRIEEWSKAYPTAVFPEPDWLKAAKLLEAGGLSIDSVSAHCMRHVVAGVGAIAARALEEVSGEDPSKKA